MTQLDFIVNTVTQSQNRQKLEAILASDLDFHGQNSVYASHAFHAFPAKFPPQIPAAFINALTQKGGIVLDPMMGSGTTLLEAALLDRNPVGFDIDPLAVLIARTKLSHANWMELDQLVFALANRAQERVLAQPSELKDTITARYDEHSRTFIDYWFLPLTQIELIALLIEIEGVSDPVLCDFLKLCFSAIIITKSGGVSMARDLAHTRPHRDLTKQPRSAITEFRKKVKQNLAGLSKISPSQFEVSRANAKQLPLPESSIDLIVTSPPYASNAIDYMRANKFSLVWLGYPIDDLGELRSTYVGSDSLTGIELTAMPPLTQRILDDLAHKDIKKSRVIHRYYSEMHQVLAEMYRVLRPDHCAVLVVGTSIIRDLDVQTQNCLGEIGQLVGFDLVGIGERQLDRDKRMMPARWNVAAKTQIEQRMHQEYVIGFYKREV